MRSTVDRIAGWEPYDLHDIALFPGLGRLYDTAHLARLLITADRGSRLSTCERVTYC